jgi:hypothetical protein
VRCVVAAGLLVGLRILAGHALSPSLSVAKIDAEYCTKLGVRTRYTRARCKTPGNTSDSDARPDLHVTPNARQAADQVQIGGMLHTSLDYLQTGLSGSAKATAWAADIFLQLCAETPFLQCTAVILIVVLVGDGWLVYTCSARHTSTTGALRHALRSALAHLAGCDSHTNSGVCGSRGSATRKGFPAGPAAGFAAAHPR